MLISSTFSFNAFFAPVPVVGVREIVLLDISPGRLSWLPDGTCLVCLGLVFDLDRFDVLLAVLHLVVEVAEQFSHVVLIPLTILLNENVTAVLRAITPLQRPVTMRSYRIQAGYRPCPLKPDSGGCPGAVVAALTPL